MVKYALGLAAICGFLITAAAGSVIVPFLRRLKAGQSIKEIGPTWHKKKEGTPTMGGLCFILGSTVALGLAWGLVAFKQPDALAGNATHNMLLAMFSAFAFGAVGFWDDYVKVVKKRNLGLKAWQKIVLQVAITAALMGGLAVTGTLTTVVVLPFIGTVDLGIAFYPIAFLLIIFMVNAVNLTDGIDGLATSITFVVMLGYLVLTSLLGFFHLSLWATALAGSCAGFLLWNFYPAKTFMGDTGSMFLGGAVTALAFCMGRPELLFFMGFVYICEAGSVVIQVTYFKLTHGKRIFKMTPIHHSFELSGWSEVKIDYVFSAVALCFVLLGILFVYVN